MRLSFSLLLGSAAGIKEWVNTSYTYRPDCTGHFTPYAIIGLNPDGQPGDRGYNPDMGMEWEGKHNRCAPGTEASGECSGGVYHGNVARDIPLSRNSGAYRAKWTVPPTLSDSDGAAFPGGYLRITNAGITAPTPTEPPIEFDLLITTVGTKLFPNERNLGGYPDNVMPDHLLQYVSPDTVTTSQAQVVAGVMCLGFGVNRSPCLNTATERVDAGVHPDKDTGKCPDGYRALNYGVEFHVRLVYPGTTHLITPPPAFGVTFYDVDGDMIEHSDGKEYALLEINGIRGSTQVTTAAGGIWNYNLAAGGKMCPAPANDHEQGDCTDLEPQRFATAETFAVEAVAPFNHRTPFREGAGTYGSRNGYPFDEAIARKAMAHFTMPRNNDFRVLIGGHSSFPEKNDRGYCFNFDYPDFEEKCEIGRASCRERV